MEDAYEVVVVGGGHAGLSAGTVLANADVRTLVVDGGSPRNGAASRSRTLYTRDGAGPTELVDAARADLEPYESVTLVDAVVESVARTDGRFEVVTTNGDCEAGTVLLATGVTDELPDVDGIDDVWGRYVHHCPVCHQWEPPWAVLGDQPMALQVLQQETGGPGTPSKIYTNGETVHGTVVDRLRDRGVDVVTEPIERVYEDDGRLVVEARDATELEALFTVPEVTYNNDLVEALGCDVLESGAVRVDERMATTVEGVFAAGDIVEKTVHKVPVAVGTGARAAMHAQQRARRLRR